MDDRSRGHYSRSLDIEFCGMQSHRLYIRRSVIDFADIKWLHVEASTLCNAWCPACPRNNKGYGLSNEFVEENLSIDIFQKTVEQLPNLECIQFCGSYGDPVACNHLNQLIDIAKAHSKKIQIHTNGSLRSAQWWHELATQLSNINHDVWFGIDGIGDIHEIYRQATSYEKVIENARAFIDAGGTATWQFIPFKHNEHQITDCIKLSQQYKFSKFKLVQSYRNITDVQHWKTGESFRLENSELYQTMFFKPKQGILKKENCIHLTQPGIYLSASGKISPCCYFANHKWFDNIEEMFYNIDIENTLDTPDTVCLANCGS